MEMIYRQAEVLIPLLGIFSQYKKNCIKSTKCLVRATHAIVISNKVNRLSLKIAKARGCFILHRLDEDFKSIVNLTKKHKQIIDINKYADITVYQSQFVKNSIQQHLKSKDWEIIINGANPEVFPYHDNNGQYVGHITNSIGWKKRLDILDQTITNYPNEKFLLIGNHSKHYNDFSRHQNVKMMGSISKPLLSQYHKQMKCLYFPSERDPCPNTVVEAIKSGVPVCYNSNGGTKEIVKGLRASFRTI